MKTDYRMKASAQEIYDTLLDSAIAEARFSGGKEITRTDLVNGYKYHRKVRKGGRDQDVVVHIRKPVENRNVHIMTAYPLESYEMDSQLEEIDGGHTMVHYEQINSLNKDRKTSLIFKWSMKKRLKQMEKYIARARKGQ
ncbi:MAG: DUF3284 domain-containing protein [Erysipelotrichaceae bacterium]|nr:DUF3284 domain-containing protein [Erysipelotrichaceae bacterium]